jgi:hypothetical protein
MSTKTFIITSVIVGVALFVTLAIVFLRSPAASTLVQIFTGQAPKGFCYVTADDQIVVEQATKEGCFSASFPTSFQWCKQEASECEPRE